MRKIKVSKKEILQRKGDLNGKVYQVEKGLLRSYTIDEKGKEHIFMFGPEGWIVADYEHPDDPAELYIDALEDSELIVFDKEFNQEPDAEKLVKRIQVLQKRVVLLMSSTALERYQHFVATYPNILQRVPQHMIASYLGITPEALSAVKSQYLKQKS